MKTIGARRWLMLAALGLDAAHDADGADARRAPSRPTDLNLLARVSDPQVSPDGRSSCTRSARPISTPIAAATTCGWSISSAEREAAPAHAALRQRHAPALVGRRQQHLFPVRAHRQPRRSGACPSPAAKPCRSPTIHSTSSTFKFSPDGSRIARRDGRVPGLRRPEVHARTPRRTARRSKSTARIFDSLFVRHWDTWSDQHALAPVRRADERRRPRRRARRREPRARRRRAVEARRRRRGIHLQPRTRSRVVFSARVAGPHRTVVDELRSVRSLERRQRAAAESHRRQSGLGHAARVPAQRRPRLARHEAARASKPIASRSWCRTAARRANSRRSGIVSVAHLGVTQRRPRRCWRPRATSASIRCSRWTSTSGARHAPFGRRVRRRVLARRAAAAVGVWHDLATPPDLYLLERRRRRGG